MPRFAFAGITIDEGIPVGFIVQIYEGEPPLPLLLVHADQKVRSMWLASTRLCMARRMGEVAFQAALAEVAAFQARVGTITPENFDELTATLSRAHHVAADEASAAAVLEDWERRGGGALLSSILASLPRGA